MLHFSHSDPVVSPGRRPRGGSTGSLGVFSPPHHSFGLRELRPQCRDGVALLSVSVVLTQWCSDPAAGAPGRGGQERVCSHCGPHVLREDLRLLLLHGEGAAGGRRWGGRVRGPHQSMSWGWGGGCFMCSPSRYVLGPGVRRMTTGCFCSWPPPRYVPGLEVERARGGVMDVATPTKVTTK